MSTRIRKFLAQDAVGPGITVEKISSAMAGQHPFTSTFSLEPLIEYWKALVDSGDEPLAPLFPQIESYLADHPDLRGAVHDTHALREHTTFLQLLSAPLFPQAYDADIPAALVVPFEFRLAHATTAFRQLFAGETDVISGRVDVDLETLTFGRAVATYIHVLQEVYDIQLPFDDAVTFTTQHRESGLDLYYKVTTDLRFVQVKTHGAVPPITPTEARRLIADTSELAAWMKAIPPSTFEFYGFAVIRAHDVTRESMVSLLYRDLADEESLVQRSVLPDIEDHIRTLLQLPEVELGLAVIDGGEFFVLNQPEHPLVDTFFARSRRYDVSALEDSAFLRCINGRCLQVVEDLGVSESQAAIERDMRTWGVRSLVAAPLHVGDDSVGILYLWSERPASLSTFDVMRALELLPIFATAVKRVRDDMRARVQQVMMGQYTAIHPAVEWRFRQAAVKSIQKQERGGSVEVEPIVFEDLYPLFAATDIRASSEHRNEAIRRDLLDHLALAEDLLIQARERKALPVIHHLLARLKRYKLSLGDALSSSDEAAVRDFLQRDLEPIILGLRSLDGRLAESIAAYEQSSTPSSGTLYQRSRAFENSVQGINDTLSDYLDDEQAKVQDVFPHYFERHQTDGVDHTMYVGPSLLEDGGYDSAYVPALRLWQLMVMCGVALRAQSLRSQLALPLETTHLILVQNTPISIRYRFDETRFDVDGPHHVRFEIMKQRVEKAYVRHSKQRLTQPDKIAIVYSQDREAQEYSEYLRLMREQGFIRSEIESLQLDDLQGMKGLRALRVKVAADSVRALPEIDADRLRESVSGLQLPST